MQSERHDREPLRPRRPMAGEELARRAEQIERFPQHGGSRRDVSRERVSAQELVETEDI